MAEESAEDRNETVVTPRGARSAARDDSPLERGVASYVGELIGTFALVFLITAVVSLYVLPPVAVAPGQAPIQEFIDFSVIGLVHVFALFFLIQTLAIVSGAHFNPAVTVAMAAIRQIRPADAGIYIAAQLLGALLGAVLTKALLVDEGDAVNYGATMVSDRLNGEAFAGMMVELIGTFFLVFAIVGVAVNPRGTKEWAGLTIGGTLGLLVMIFGPLTGAGFNPARSFGPAVVSGEFGGTGEFLLTYVAGPVLGAVLAAVVYFRIFILPGAREPGGLEPVG